MIFLQRVTFTVARKVISNCNILHFKSNCNCNRDGDFQK